MIRTLSVLMLLAFSLSGISVARAAGTTITVGSQGKFASIQDALVAAQPGDVIQVQPGIYSGPIVVDKAVILEGMGQPVIDAGGQGTVVTLAADGAVLRGFEIQASGNEPDRDHAGVTVTAPNVVVENNRLTDVLFGIFVAQADRVILRNNDITSKQQYDTGRRGDGIRLWYSKNALVEANHIHDARDIVIWYSESVQVRNNLIENGRYGIHLMYCNQARIESNRLYDNSVGIYTMYSSDILLEKNDIRRQRGPSGAGLGFKDADAVVARNNVLVDNRVGIFLDHTPFNPASTASFTDNILAFNDIGVVMLTAVAGTSFESNTFWENQEQVAIQGSGLVGANLWQGNYWSDYAGYDLNGDGKGETAYISDRLFESLIDREPLLRALQFSPATQTIEFAASSFPIFKPQPKLSDPYPAAHPASLPNFLAQPGAPTLSMFLVGVGVLAGALLFIVVLYIKEVILWENKILPQGKSNMGRQA